MNLSAHLKRDFLTQCLLREDLEALSQKLIVEYNLHKRPFSLILLDVDKFKSYNDTHGHKVGDDILKYFSSSIRLYFEGMENYVFRLGGDEFVILLPRTTVGQALELAQKLQKNLKKRPFLYQGKYMLTTFSAGIVAYPIDGSNLENLLENADKAMYVSKRHGRSRVTPFHGRLQAHTIHYLKKGSPYIIAAFLILAIFATGQWTSQSIKTGARWVLRPIITGLTNLHEKLKGQEVLRTELPTSKIHLNSGGSIEGIITTETQDEVVVEYELQGGITSSRIKKNQILKIER